MGGTIMSIIDMEILEYINNSNYDENVKKFLRWAIIDEVMNPNKIRYKQEYENQMENILEID